ncbi:MAG TPA: response regulator [Bryobacteraceae bacterium]|nr:response regulator [Bryobacteraceae bacterium]
MVLIVDDERAIREFVRGVLEREGYEVIEAGGSAEALGILAEKSADLLLTDVVMPDMNGLELAAQVHKLYPQLPVVFMTGFAEEYRDVLTGTVCLPKPFKVGELLSIVENVIGPPSKTTRGSTIR